MEGYGETQAMESVHVDPVSEWATPGDETGLEEPIWQLGLAGGPESYLERPNEPDCIHYLRTGFCGYGKRCRFKHPPNRGMGTRTLGAGGDEYPEREGQPVCQYYMRTGMCKFGASCKYHHPKQGYGSPTPLTLNVYGYPLRLGEKECSYYIKTGQCKFGVTCKFHHPQPAGIQVPVGPRALPAPSVYPTVQSLSIQSSQQYGVIQGNWPVPQPPLLSGSYVGGSYGPMFLPQVVPVPGWTPYQVQGSAGPINSPSTQTTVGGGQIYGLPQLSPLATAYTPQYPSIASAGPSSSSQKEHAFPERPGQPECQYYLRTGDCKYGATCKYHHPPGLTALNFNVILSPMGLPLRSGAPLCSHYAQNGVCKFGPSCKFDHPIRILSYSRSASSLTDMQVAPYPVGSTNATLAPSSSSSDLRPELLSGLTKDAFSSQMSSVNTSSASVGSIFSAVPQLSSQQSGQGPIASSGNSGTSHAGEAHTSS